MIKLKMARIWGKHAHPRMIHNDMLRLHADYPDYNRIFNGLVMTRTIVEIVVIDLNVLGRSLDSSL